MPSLPRIVLIGPVLPWRGGIAEYTTMLHRALTQQCELLTLSFRQLYPNWLYPGKDARNPEWLGHQERGVKYVFDPLLPHTWQQACALCRQHQADAVVMSWWTPFLAPCCEFFTRALRRRHIATVLLCHNVIDHETSWWKERLYMRVLRQGDAFVTTNRRDAQTIMQRIPQAKVTFYPHPVAAQFPPPRYLLAREARLELLFYGFVRHYKGLDVLLDAMESLSAADIKLTVAGEWWSEWPLQQRLQSAQLRQRVRIVDRYVTAAETAELFARADVVVLPYRSGSGSGVIPQAYHYGKPVIATTAGGLPDAVEDGVSGFLIAPENPQALAAAISRFLAVPPPDMRDGVTRVAANMTWQGLATHIVRFVAAGL